MKQRTVMQVLPRLVTGGVERGTVETTAALTKAGWKAVVASAGGPMVDEITKAGGVHVTLPLASKNPLTILENITRLAKVVEEHNVDIIHARSRAPAWSAYYAARKTRRHFVTTFHNAYGAKSAIKRWYNSVMAKGELVIAISNFVAAYAEQIYHVPHAKLRTIPRGVDIERFDPARVEAARVQKLKQEWGITNDNPIIILPGRLTRWKGQLIFIDALAKMKRRDITCLIVGSGDADYKQELQTAIMWHHLSDVVRLVDECRNMPAALQLADIMISASTRPEGFGRVIVEAQAMGCVVIASDHGGAAETIINNRNGVLVPVGDAMALATALEQTLTMSESERKKMAQNAITDVRKNFTTALMTSRTLAVYNEIIGTP